MKYLCLVYTEEAKLAALSDKDFAALDVDSLGYDKEMRDGGHLAAESTAGEDSTSISHRALRESSRRRAEEAGELVVDGD
jgi:hypothetical protein